MLNGIYGLVNKFLMTKPKPDLVAIGSRIRQLRGSIFQEDMADYLRISQGQLSKIERGKTAPTIHMLILISHRFRKSVDWVLLGEERW